MAGMEFLPLGNLHPQSIVATHHKDTENPGIGHASAQSGKKQEASRYKSSVEAIGRRLRFNPALRQYFRWRRCLVLGSHR
jgi:hypothetical protein